MISVDRVFPSSDKAKLLLPQTALAPSYSSQGELEGKKVYLNPGFGLLSLHGNLFIHNVSFIHEILLTQEGRYLKMWSIVNYLSTIVNKLRH